MRVGLLGSLVVNGGGRIEPPPKQRVVLAALALRPGEVVSSSDLIDLVWDGETPGTARVALRNSVLRLRRLFGTLDGLPIRTVGSGYLLGISSEQVDALAFTRLCEAGVSAGQAGNWTRAEETLRGALGMWRGAPLADIPSQALQQTWVPHLERLHLQALEYRIEADVRLGGQDRVIGELRQLIAAFPLRERLRGLLMVALYQAGRQGEALVQYQQARQVLSDELGVGPGEELRALHQRILVQDPGLAARSAAASLISRGESVLTEDRPAGAGLADGGNQGSGVAGGGVVARQVPAGVAGFSGRAGELRVLEGLAGRAVGGGGAGQAVVISAIAGMAGVGKTALAVHFAHRVAGWFPDGQLYADLRGFDPDVAPVAPGLVLRGFLAALGVAADQVPGGVEEQAGLYRSLLAGRRVLVLLDNARDAEQVRPLIPGNPGTLVLITSRNHLTGLADSARIALGVFSDAEANAMLATRLGPGVVAAQPDAAKELVRLCARLPLALGVTAALAAARPAVPLADLAAELRDADRRLDALDTDDKLSVRAVFSWSYHRLTTPAARMFRLLGMHPGPDISAAAAASLAGEARDKADAALRELTAANLVIDHVPGRFLLHDLLRCYAAELGDVTDGASGRRAAIRRTLDHYLHTANNIPKAEYRQVRVAEQDGAVTPETITRAGGFAWFDAEYRILLRLVSVAAAEGFIGHAWRLPWIMNRYLEQRGHLHDWAATQHIALSAAMSGADREGQAHAVHSLGMACIERDDFAAGRHYLQRALRLYAQLGDRGRQAHVHLCLSVMFYRQGLHPQTVASADQARRLAGSVGLSEIQAAGLNNAAQAYATHGNYRQALRKSEEALRLNRKVGEDISVAANLSTLGYIYGQLGRHAEAVQSYRNAIAVLGDNVFKIGLTLIDLGNAYFAAGDTATAREKWQDGRTLLDGVQHLPYAAKVLARFEDLDVKLRDGTDLDFLRVPVS